MEINCAATLSTSNERFHHMCNTRENTRGKMINIGDCFRY